jgi:DNA-binding beta-propeller fold protein YncE
MPSGINRLEQKETKATKGWLLGTCLLFVVAGDLSAADLVYPLDVAVKSDGSLIVADRKLPGVVRISDGAATVLAQGSPRYREPLNAVWSVAVDSQSRVLVGDSSARAVYRLGDDGAPTKINTTYVGIPIRMVVDSQGRIYVSDLETQRIWRFPADGGEAEEFAVVAGVRGLAIDGQQRLWTVRANPPQVVRYSAAGQPETIVDEGPFEFPHQIAVDPSGETAYVADGYAKSLWRVKASQTPEKWVSGEPFQNPVGLAWSGANLLVVDPKLPAVLQVSPDGAVSRFFPASSATP